MCVCVNAASVGRAWGSDTDTNIATDSDSDADSVPVSDVDWWRLSLDAFSAFSAVCCDLG